MQRSRTRQAKGPRAGRTEREAAEPVHGLRAGLAVFASRPGDILRIAHSSGVRREVAAIVEWAAEKGTPCRELHDDELNRFAESAHHEGLCIVTRPRRWLSTNDLTRVLSSERGCAIALDRVRNPYNVGAIVRSAAFFGLDAVLVGAPAPHSGLAPAAVRVAEGGAEHVPVARTTDLADTLSRLRGRGIRVVGADGRSVANAFGFEFGRPVVLAMGNEREGLGPRVRAQCDALVAIPGHGGVESLNVAVAAGLLIAEMIRRPAR